MALMPITCRPMKIRPLRYDGCAAVPPPPAGFFPNETP